MKYIQSNDHMKKLYKKLQKEKTLEALKAYLFACDKHHCQKRYLFKS